MRVGEIIRSFDWVLLGYAVLLNLISLAMLVSSTYTETLISGQVVRQGVALLAGLGVVALLSYIPYHALGRFAPALYAIALSGVVLVFFAGQVIRGTASRLTLAGWQLQL